VGYALYTTHERPVFFNQPISTGKNFFRFEVNATEKAGQVGDFEAFHGNAREQRA
jgi:hypothetical protein